MRKFTYVEKTFYFFNFTQFSFLITMFLINFSLKILTYTFCTQMIQYFVFLPIR